MNSSVQTRTRTAVKSHARPVLKLRRTARKEPPVLKARSDHWHSVWQERERKFAELFGPALPKGKVLGLDGECVAPKEVLETGWCLLQFPPRPGRINWIYATHGLSQLARSGAHGTVGFELMIYWPKRDKVPARILAHTARALIGGECSFEPGQIITVTEVLPEPSTIFKHCVACQPDATIPGHITFPGGSLNALLLVAISDAEREYALRVNPEIANGRQVLLEALRSGGVFPVSDHERICMTRRRDFTRLWENAFRIVRERGAV